MTRLLKFLWQQRSACEGGNINNYNAHCYTIQNKSDHALRPQALVDITYEYLTSCFCFGRSTVDDLWEMAAAKIAPVLLTCTQSVRHKLRIN